MGIPMKSYVPRRALIANSAWGAVLLLSAGTLRWPSAWIYIVGTLSLTVLSSYLLHRDAPDIAAERTRGPFQKGQTLSDRIMLSIMITTNVVLMVVVGMDRRFGWSDVPPVVQIAGAAFILTTAYTTYRVARENKFASLVVKLQKDRGQKVIDTGPYQYVRHPMYSGLIFRIIGTPLLLGSWWGLCLSIVAIIIVVVRIFLEERTLTTGLEGYAGYIERVPYRLIPLVW
jgi:protein-S-isoprenylcysteine O-methyltransferase Ste14